MILARMRMGLVAAAVAAMALAIPVAAAPSSFVRVLSDDDAATYRAAFKAAAAGDTETARQAAVTAKDKLLQGHLAAKILLSPRTVASFDELKAWLAKYSDYPEAMRIHALALRKAPSRARELTEPPRRIIRGGSEEPEGRPDFESPKGEAAASRIRTMLRAGQVAAASRYIESAELKAQLSRADYGQLVHQVAAGEYYLGDAATALAMADRVARDVRADVPEADWIAGLAAFSLNRFDTAAGHFEAMARNEASTSWLKAAAGFWAARAWLLAREPERVAPMLEVASQKSRTFYGLLALRLLGREPPFTWEEPSLEKAGFQRMLKVPSIARAVALYQVGELENAEGSLARAHGRLSPELDRPFVALSHELGFAFVQLLGAHAAREPELKAAAYPVMSIRPTDGWTTDPALVHAIVRQESKFEMRVTSSSDARGLMQLMPATAAGTMKDTTLDNPGAKARLFDPAFNLSIGQRYLQKMFSFVEPDGDLIKLVVSYNGGPGNMQKWFGDVQHRGDPLLFIESLPSRETRGYVERVIANYWIYQDRLGERKTTLDQLARGEWPVVRWDGRARVATLAGAGAGR